MKNFFVLLLLVVIFGMAEKPVLADDEGDAVDAAVDFFEDTTQSTTPADVYLPGSTKTVRPDTSDDE
jgi:hypothetical protein